MSRQVKDAGLLARATGFYIRLLAALAGALVAITAGVVLLGDSWLQLLLAAALGLVLTQVAFVAHEALHHQVFEAGPANERLGRFLSNAVLGVSDAWWVGKHNRHHANPNQVGRDPDIEMATFAFDEATAVHRRGLRGAFTRRQGYFFFPLLLLEGGNLHRASLHSLAASPAGRSRTVALWTIGLRLGGYVAILAWIFPPALAAAFLAVQLAVFGVYMGASFAPNHKGMPVISAESRLDFLTKQVLTARNVTGGRFVTFLLGGLNYQIEHHLFPSLPRPHLAAAQVFVRAHCAEHRLPYTEASLFGSYAIVVRYLNRVGLAARDPFDCPARRQMGAGGLTAQPPERVEPCGPLTG